jgi:hypothetical protein
VILRIICVYVSEREGTSKAWRSAYEQYGLYLCLYILGMQLLYSSISSMKIGYVRSYRIMTKREAAWRSLLDYTFIYFLEMPDITVSYSVPGKTS